MNKIVHNPNTQVKICGLSRAEDIQAANELKPDYIGFMLWPNSKRAVTFEQARELRKQLDEGIKAVGVFVNEEAERIAEIAKSGVIDMVQLHGDEDLAFCEKLKTLIDLPVVKAVRVRGEDSFLGLEAYPVDYFLFDTYVPGQYGGTGKRFNLKLGDDKKISKPYFVAGGLDAGNVCEVLAETYAMAVDVSGGVETDGVKDYNKIAAFIKSVRGE